MHCDRFETRVHELLDERRPIDLLAESELLEHARACPSCCDFALGMGMLFDGLRQPVQPGAPADLVQRVVADLEPPQVIRLPTWTRQRATWTRRRVATLALAAAATVLLAVGLMRRGGQHDSGQRDTPTAVSPDALLLNVASTPTSADEYLELARQAQHSLASAWSIWPDSPRETMATQQGSAVDRTSDDVWGRELGESLLPVTRSTSGALDSLRRLLPSGSEELRS